ncbi:glycosyltransferase [Falsirhodobacter sp. 1013]|uniref:glycosyltransferase n=1 Tax=Falsirhodobacter sp. 1013 TaxID=3417566 RepID=UPI003EC01C2C
MTPSLGLWSLFNRIAPPPPRGVVEGDRFHAGGDIDADVCIVTNCAFVGGNAMTTLTEYQTLTAAGMTVVIVHCPVKRSPWKRHRIAERFMPYQHAIVPAHAVGQIRCKTLIARGPRMVMTPNFARLIPRIQADRALYIVNNSAWNEDGKPLFDWPALHRRVAEIGLPRSRIHPISPIIRAESDKALQGTGIPDRLSSEDWPPAFRTDLFQFRPRAQLTAPIVIGRHARDHASKWLEDPTELAAAYPDRPDIRVSIMGGADTAQRRLGTLPANWTVLPFGTTGVEAYLAALDVFVYFPARTRDEAFGRTVIEAVMSGLPVVLPPFFEPTFGDLALYCEPHEVEGVIDRLTADDAGRLHYLAACRDDAAARFSTDTLLRRMGGEVVHPPGLDARARAFRQAVLPAATQASSSATTAS